MARVFYLSHPQVEIEAEVPVERWRLNELGRRRIAAALFFWMAPECDHDLVVD